MISCGSGAIKKEECDVVVYGREVASVDAPSLSATPLVIVMVMVRRSGQPPAARPAMMRKAGRKGTLRKIAGSRVLRNGGKKDLHFFSFYLHAKHKPPSNHHHYLGLRKLRAALSETLTKLLLPTSIRPREWQW